MPSTPITIRIVVVFPAPFPPTKPVIAPPGTGKPTPSTAVWSPNRLVSPRVSSIVSPWSVMAQR